MSQALPEAWFAIDTRNNAVITWILVALLTITVVANLFVGYVLGAAFAAIATVTAVVPPLVARSWSHTLPWPLLAVASLPLVLGPLQPAFLGQFFIGVGVAVLSMLVVSTLQLTTMIRMTPAFAVFFVCLTTLAVAGFWSVGSAFSAAYLGGTFVKTNDELMLVFSVALVAGLVSGLSFWLYFRWRLRREQSPSREVEPT
ncbi:hypothetical protein [Natronorubrum aibiense]|uniref:DUF1097 domain-containing protein n=1 Tax=Natronorubrum aibiense TaxID=348826 RepID=A0A5P9P0X3_9EURY|nr:hypothetical protein [Natronorubrum aibiense]QFU81785.1 hypothetical protein GCU68_04105 [Natronorubrum aibiense]